MNLDWRIADDANVVHELLEVSDVGAAERTGTTAPQRRRASTAALVENRRVWLGLLAGRPVVTVTAGPEPSFDPAAAGELPNASAPWYMQRLAMDPDCPDRLASFHAVRHVLAVAESAGADALRAEANPRLDDVLRVLVALRFVRYKSDLKSSPPRTYLQRAL